MKWEVFENGSLDPEVLVLDTKMEYFMNRMSHCCDADVEVHIVRSFEDFKNMTGEELNGQCSKFSENKVFIMEPSKFSETHHDRNEFYEILYKQLFTIMYKNKK
jgi:hypothetical protein